MLFTWPLTVLTCMQWHYQRPVVLAALNNVADAGSSLLYAAASEAATSIGAETVHSAAQSTGQGKQLHCTRQGRHVSQLSSGK